MYFRIKNNYSTSLFTNTIYLVPASLTAATDSLCGPSSTMTGHPATVPYLQYVSVPCLFNPPPPYDPAVVVSPALSLSLSRSRSSFSAEEERQSARCGPLEYKLESLSPPSFFKNLKCSCGSEIEPPSPDSLKALF